MTSVRESNMANPVYRFCYTVAEHILAEEAGVYKPVTFRRLTRSRAPGRTIEFGYASIKESWCCGCPEYVRAAEAAGIGQLSEAGWAGVHHEVIHEAAHVLQLVKDGRSDGHGRSFGKMLHWLSIAYPLARCLGIAGVDAGEAPEGWGTAELPAMPQRKPAAQGRELVFVVKMREKRQAWSVRLQRDGVTVHIAIGLREWNRIADPADRMMLISYLKAKAAEFYQGERIDFKLAADYEVLRRRQGWG